LSSSNGTMVSKVYDSFGGSTLQPMAVNDLGQLTGYASTAGDAADHAFVWKNDGSPTVDLGTLGGDSSYGYGINASGQVAGSFYPHGGAFVHAFLWKNDGTAPIDLGSLGGDYSQGFFINASGQVAGESAVVKRNPNLNPRVHAFLWRNDGTPMQDLGTLGGTQSDARALNDAGQVAGNSYTFKSGRKIAHAFAWLNDGTPMKALGTLGGTTSTPNDINSSGQVTGNATLAGDAAIHAFLWRNDGTKIQDLNKLIDPNDPLRPYVTLTNGQFINDSGDIAAEGSDSRTGLDDVYLLQGTVLTLAPRSLAFGNQPVHTTSAAKSVTMTNTSAKVVAIASINLNGTAAGQFAATNNCGSSLVGHATCTIKVTFKPTTKGAKSASLSVNGGGGGLRVASLAGTGV
jgi:probable HAF family extracellular repeat protein